MNTHPLPEQLSAWVDDALPSPEGAAVATHVSTCAACRAQADEVRTLSALLAAMPTPAIPAGLVDGIARAVMAEQHTVGVARRALSLRTLAAAFGAAALASILVVVPVLGVGLRSMLLWVGLSIKDVVLLAWDLIPVAKALVVLAQQIYLPLLIATALTAALPLVLAGRLMGPSRPQLGGA